MKCIKCSIETGADWKKLCYPCYKNRSVEEIRADRQAKLDRKIERLENKATWLEKEAGQKMSCFDPYKGDIAFYTQPATPTSSFGRYRNKLNNRFDKGIELSNEAEELRKKAEWLQAYGVRVKGDAERAREIKRKKADMIYRVGSRVYDCFGEGIITKINKKTFTIKFDTGSTYTRDKSYFVR